MENEGWWLDVAVDPAHSRETRAVATLGLGYAKYIRPEEVPHFGSPFAEEAYAHAMLLGAWRLGRYRDYVEESLPEGHPARLFALAVVGDEDALAQLDEMGELGHRYALKARITGPSHSEDRERIYGTDPSDYSLAECVSIVAWSQRVERYRQSRPFLLRTGPEESYLRASDRFALEEYQEAFVHVCDAIRRYPHDLRATYLALRLLRAPGVRLRVFPYLIPAFRGYRRVARDFFRIALGSKEGD